MKLAEIVGYQISIARSAVVRSVERCLADTPFRAVDTTALLMIRSCPGCDQTSLGRALSANRSVGMKVANRLEAQGLLTRGAGRDRRSRGLSLTTQGEHVLDELLDRHRRAEEKLTARLNPGERDLLISLLGKVRRAIEEEEADLRGGSLAPEASGQILPRASVERRPSAIGQ